MNVLKMALCGAGLAVCASTAQADFSALHGKWVPEDGPCTFDGHQSDAMMTLGPTNVRYWESGCNFIGAPQAMGVGLSYGVRMQCSGEGETWQDTVLYSLTEEGKLMVYFQNTYGYVARRCQ